LQVSLWELLANKWISINNLAAILYKIPDSGQEQTMAALCISLLLKSLAGAMVEQAGQN